MSSVLVRHVFPQQQDINKKLRNFSSGLRVFWSDAPDSYWSSMMMPSQSRAASNPTIGPTVADIESLRSYAMEEDWDGKNAMALHEDTITVALDLAKRLHYIEGLAPPDVSATARGQIDFAWDCEDRILMMGVCPPPTHIIAFAGMFGDGDDLRACVPWRHKRRVLEILAMYLDTLSDPVS